MDFNKNNYSGKNNFRAKPENKDNMVFGSQSVMETLRSGKEIDRILIQKENTAHAEILTIAHQRRIPMQRVPIYKLNSLTLKNHQGIICFTSAVNYAKLSNVLANTFESGKVPLFLVLDKITDVRNFGAIARTAECAGVDAIIIPARGAAQINADAMKTSSGALNFVPVCREGLLTDTIKYLQDSGVQVVACTEKTNDGIYAIDFRLPTAILMGAEDEGISPELLKKADYLASIPMLGQVGSLNVSVATAVILYEAVRQRN